MKVLAYLALAVTFSAPIVLPVEQSPEARKLIRVRVTVAVASKGQLDLSNGAAALVGQLSKLEREGKIQLFDRFSLTTVEDKEASMKVRGTGLLKTGWTVSARGDQRDTIQREDVGTTVSVHPTIVGNKVRLKIRMDKKWLGFSGVKELPRAKFSAQVSTTVRAEDGGAIALRTAVAPGNNLRNDVVVIVSPEVL